MRPTQIRDKKMKKIILFSFCLIAFVSCKKSDIDIFVRNISIHAGETDFISASSDYDLSYRTDTKHFIFDCDESGNLKGNHVGKGTVTVSNGKTDDFVNVEVAPRHCLWNLPDVHFGCSILAVTTLMGAPDAMGCDDDYCYYTYLHYGDAEEITFIFDENNQLFCYGMVCSTDHHLNEFLHERYEYYCTTEDDLLIYGDADSMNDATLFAACVQFDSKHHIFYCDHNIFNSFASNAKKIANHLK